MYSDDCNLKEERRATLFALLSFYTKSIAKKVKLWYKCT